MPQDRLSSDYRLANNEGRYCESSELGLWKAVIETADKAMAMDFLDYLCDTFKITSSGTSWEYFRQYKQLYSSVSGRYMDTNDTKEIRKVSRYNAFFYSSLPEC